MAVCKPQHHLCHSAWEDQRCWCANICHMALPARASPCQYVNSGMPAPLISHTLNEILALQNKSVQKLHCSNSFLVDSLIMAPCTWFTFVLHRAPLALDTYMLVHFRILWHKLVIVWLVVPHGKYWHCVTSKHSGLRPTASCFDGIHFVHRFGGQKSHD